jgi:hypothetical protein
MHRPGFFKKTLLLNEFFLEKELGLRTITIRDSIEGDLCRDWGAAPSTPMSRIRVGWGSLLTDPVMEGAGWLFVVWNDRLHRGGTRKRPEDRAAGFF